MPTDHILSLLIAERDKLNSAIALLGGTPAKKRGRPRKDSMPDWVTSKQAASHSFSARIGSGKEEAHVHCQAKT